VPDVIDHALHEYAPVDDVMPEHFTVEPSLTSNALLVQLPLTEAETEYVPEQVIERERVAAQGGV
jgi:hypothetical protein